MNHQIPHQIPGVNHSDKNEASLSRSLHQLIEEILNIGAEMPEGSDEHAICEGIALQLLAIHRSVQDNCGALIIEQAVDLVRTTHLLISAMYRRPGRTRRLDVRWSPPARAPS